MLRRYCSKITSTNKHSLHFVRYKSSSLDNSRVELTPKEIEFLLQPDEEELNFSKLQPEEIKSELDKWIIGQDEAKIAIAVALRNRWRRTQVPEEIKKEIIPKNILMIGPSGCGKTEIARRMATLAAAPFIKVEATKYTEVGYKGADVDSIIKGLVDVGIKKVKDRVKKGLEKVLKEKADNILIEELIGTNAEESVRLKTREDLRSGLLDESVINNPKFRASLDDASPTVKDLRANWIKSQLNTLVTSFESSAIIPRGLKEAQEFGIVYIDEIDKIVNTGFGYHADASDEGVQRDLLPLIEGTRIKTDHGDVDTSKMLFIAAGAFLQTKPQDLLAELQGRLPIRIQLKSLTQHELYRVLTEPDAPLILKEKAMLKTEGVDLRFTDEAVMAIAKAANDANDTVENIGARRLHTVVERVIEDISYNVEEYQNRTFVIDEEYVADRLKELNQKVELKKYIL
jgi:ATP-dependent HslUV protease ATP-binding subunit HslU